MKFMLIVLALVFAFISLCLFQAGMVWLVFGTPISDSKENTEKVANLLAGEDVRVSGRIIYTGPDFPWIGISTGFTLFTTYQIEDVGVVWRWSEAHRLISARLEESKKKKW